MNKGLLLMATAITALTMASCSSAPEQPEQISSIDKPVIWDIETIDLKAGRIAAGETDAIFEQMKVDADALLDIDNPTVTSKPNAPAAGTMNDYMSLSRYWWPDPKTQYGLPYVRLDGVSNPELKEYDRNTLGKLASSIRTLSLVYYITGEQKYADKANSMLHTWFINPETLMNPNFQFGQVRRGHFYDNGTQYGVLDGYSFVEMLDAVALLEAKKAIPQEISQGMQKWFADLSEWLLTSENGIAEGNGNNNHAVAYDAQVIRYAMYGGRDDIARKIINEFPARRLETQIEPDGQMPVELARTNGFGYTQYNITHMIDICDMAAALGIDLYPATNNAIERAIDWIVPYSVDQPSFPYKQIGSWSSARESLARAVFRAAKYGKTDEYLKYYDTNKAEKESSLFEFMYIK